MGKKQKPEYPKTPKSHLTRNVAQRIFESSLPENWHWYEPKEDYGIDYVVEVGTNDQLIGMEFHVQLKGSGEFREGEDGLLRIDIKARTLNYWLKHLGPVMIVCANVETQEVYYSWLEDAYPDYPDEVAGQKEKTISIEKNIFCTPNSHKEIYEYLSKKASASKKRRESIKRFAQSSELTEENIEDMFADFPRLSVLEQVCETIDPRFKIRIDSEPGKTRVFISPKGKNPIKFNIIANPETREKIERCRAFGEKVVLKPDEVEVSDIDNILNVLAPGLLPKEIIFQRGVPKTEILTILEQIKGTGEAKILMAMRLCIHQVGDKQITLALSANQFPLIIYIAVNTSSESKKSKLICESDHSKCSLKVALKSLMMMKDLLSGSRIKVKNQNDDSTVMEFVTRKSTEVQNIDNEIEMISDMVLVNEKFNTSLSLPVEINQANMNNLCYAAHVVKHGYLDKEVKDVSANADKVALRDLAIAFNIGSGLLLTQKVDNYLIDIFGQKINLGEYEAQIKDIVPALSPEELLKKVEEMSENEIMEVKFIPFDVSKGMIMRCEFNTEKFMKNS